MRETNFSESQLQQAVNDAYIRFIFEQRQVWVFANVPSLFDEFDLGWDSAFFFPWNPHVPHPDHEGCNFFIQYKLSGELTSAGAKEWEYWRAPYYRFKIPHSTKDGTGKFVDDYHQWDRLKELADQGYPTFYATNATLSKEELQAASVSGTLLNDIPMLDVRGVTTRHKKVTFAPSSTFFLLHSEKKETFKVNFAAIIEQLSGYKTLSLKASSEALLLMLIEIGNNNESWYRDLQKITQANDSKLLMPFHPWITQALLVSFIRKHIGAEMFWLPKHY